jgi:hypothetical protein
MLDFLTSTGKLGWHVCFRHERQLPFAGEQRLRNDDTMQLAPLRRVRHYLGLQVRVDRLN